MECKYCSRKHRKPLLSESSLYAALISGYPNGPTILFAMAPTSPDGEMESCEIEINFCPICGEQFINKLDI